jgi:hypothetical protein
MAAMVVMVGLVYGVSVTVLGGTAVLAIWSPKVRESLIGKAAPAL